MRKFFFIITVLCVSFGFSQRLHFQYGFKMGMGKNFIQGEIEIDNGYNHTYLLGFTGRVTKKIAVFDMGINYSYSPYFNSPYVDYARANTSMLNIPLTGGINIINRALFKWNIQAGIQNSFVFTHSVNALNPLVYNPYQISGIVSTGIEASWFILDIYYQPAISRMFKGQNSSFNQSFNLSIGVIF